eukprot:8299928-Alexandrium_andersonii.AAC.1
MTLLPWLTPLDRRRSRTKAPDRRSCAAQQTSRHGRAKPQLSWSRPAPRAPAWASWPRRLWADRAAPALKHSPIGQVGKSLHPRATGGMGVSVAS